MSRAVCVPSLAVVVAAALLSACGGGGEPTAQPSAAAGGAAGARRALATPDRKPLAAGDTITATELMNWAEGQFPQFFPSREQNQTIAPFVFRFYPGSQNYLGVDGETIYVLGPVSGGQLLAVGTLGGFACDVKFASCDAPTVAAAPQPATVAAGATATFSATIGGGPSISYQWLRNGAPIAGATGLSYSLVAQSADNGAAFALRASNAKGSVTSAAATLTVNRVVDGAAAMALAQGLGCFSCHGVALSGIGPAFRSIGLRYAGNAAILPTLVSRVRNGSSGNWPGFSFMPAQSHASPEEAEQVVEWILTLR